MKFIATKLQDVLDRSKQAIADTPVYGSSQAYGMLSSNVEDLIKMLKDENPSFYNLYAIQAKFN